MALGQCKENDVESEGANGENGEEEGGKNDVTVFPKTYLGNLKNWNHVFEFAPFGEDCNDGDDESNQEADRDYQCYY